MLDGIRRPRQAAASSTRPASGPPSGSSRRCSTCSRGNAPEDPEGFDDEAELRARGRPRARRRRRGGRGRRVAEHDRRGRVALVARAARAASSSCCRPSSRPARPVVLLRDERPAARPALGGGARARDPRRLVPRHAGRRGGRRTCCSATSRPAASCRSPGRGRSARCRWSTRTRISHEPENQGRRYWDEESTPLFPFGHGLAYARFEYADLALDRDAIAPDETRDRVGGRHQRRRRARPTRWCSSTSTSATARRRARSASSRASERVSARGRGDAHGHVRARAGRAALLERGRARLGGRRLDVRRLGRRRLDRRARGGLRRGLSESPTRVRAGRTIGTQSRTTRQGVCDVPGPRTVGPRPRARSRGAAAAVRPPGHRGSRQGQDRGALRRRPGRPRGDHRRAGRSQRGLSRDREARPGGVRELHGQPVLAGGALARDVPGSARRPFEGPRGGRRRERRDGAQVADREDDQHPRRVEGRRHDRALRQSGGRADRRRRAGRPRRLPDDQAACRAAPQHHHGAQRVPGGDRGRAARGRDRGLGPRTAGRRRHDQRRRRRDDRHRRRGRSRRGRRRPGRAARARERDAADGHGDATRGPGPLRGADPVRAGRRPERGRHLRAARRRLRRHVLSRLHHAADRVPERVGGGLRRPAGDAGARALHGVREAQEVRRRRRRGGPADQHHRRLAPADGRGEEPQQPDRGRSPPARRAPTTRR